MSAPHSPYGMEVFVQNDENFIRSKMVWIDMETTGLDHDASDVPLEVGCIITDKDGNEKATFRSLIISNDWEFRLERANEFVRDMHLKNNLKFDLSVASGDADLRRSLSFNQVDAELKAFLDTFGGAAGIMEMCGSTINFDRNFMKFLPTSLQWFHYRNMDVSSLMNFCRMLNRPVYDACPKVPADKKKHRVLDDIRDSIKFYQFYKDNFLFVA